MSPSRPRRARTVAVVAVLALSAAGCGGFAGLFRPGRDCPRDAVVEVTNHSEVTVDVFLIHERNEIALGAAAPGRSIFALPDGTARTARFTSRRSRVGPGPAQPRGSLLAPLNVSYYVRCR